MRLLGLPTLLLILPALAAQTQPRAWDCLRPLDWCDGEIADYFRRVDDLLGFDVRHVVMLTRPSFTSESLIRLELVNGEAVRTERAEPRYEVHHAVTNSNVWYADHGEWTDEATEPASYRERQATFERLMDEWDKNGRKPPMPRQTRGPSLLEHIRVAKRRAPFPSPLALRICTVWRRMLLGVRYPETWGAGLDGTDYVFAAEHRVGQVWSPEDGSTPKLLVDVGESLAAYALSKDDERDAALRVVEARVLALETRLDERAKATTGDKGK